MRPEMILLREKFSAKSVTAGPMVLLRPEDALDYVEQAQEASLEVIGLEGFRLLAEGGIQPDMTMEVSLEHCQSPKDLQARVLRLLRSFQGDQLVAFEIYLDET